MMRVLKEMEDTDLELTARMARDKLWLTGIELLPVLVWVFAFLVLVSS